MELARADIELRQGDAYHRDDERELTWTGEPGYDWPDLSGDPPVTFTMKAITTTDRFTKSGRVIDADPAQVGVELTALETSGLDAVLYNYEVDVAISGRNMTIAEGRIRVTDAP